MLSTRGFDLARGSAPSSFPDTASPVYPDRPIRPLPRHPIKSRLSLEQANGIVFPPTATSSSPSFESPQSQSERTFVNPHYSGNVDVLRDDQDLEHVCDCGGHHSGLESEEDEEFKDRSIHRNSWPGRMLRLPREYPVRAKPPPPKSPTSSADGYESFENTNNKKKRKVPISTAPGASSSSYVTSMGIPTQSVDVSMPEDRNGNVAQYYSSSAGPYSSGPGVGISGAGRGRHSKTNSRMMSERRPLFSTNNGANTLPNPATSNRQGIISAAIANATESGGALSPNGQENISLLQRQHPGSSVPKDFTFECPSNSSNKIGLSTRPATHAGAVDDARRGYARTQSNPAGPRPGNLHAPSQPSAPPNTAQYPPADHPTQQKPKSRRPGQSLRVAAEQRKAAKTYENFHNPPKREDVWLCGYCEYESIFGEPPRALIKQYEMKDRNARNKQEAKRVALEKLKAKNKKKRSGAKGGGKGPAAAGGEMPPSTSQFDQQYDAPLDPDSQEEEFLDDGYDDGGDQPPELSPLDHGSVARGYEMSGALPSGSGVQARPGD